MSSTSFSTPEGYCALQQQLLERDESEDADQAFFVENEEEMVETGRVSGDSWGSGTDLEIF